MALWKYFACLSRFISLELKCMLTVLIPSQTLQIQHVCLKISGTSGDFRITWLGYWDKAMFCVMFWHSPYSKPRQLTITLIVFPSAWLLPHRPFWWKPTCFQPYLSVVSDIPLLNWLRPFNLSILAIPYTAVINKAQVMLLSHHFIGFRVAFSTLFCRSEGYSTITGLPLIKTVVI